MNGHAHDLSLFPDVAKVVASVFNQTALEAHPFLIEWYNDLVGEKFKMEYHPKTLCLVIISGPDTFEKNVLPFLEHEYKKDPQNIVVSDPLDNCMKQAFNTLKQEFTKNDIVVEAIHDFDLHPNRRPKILVQTAAHAAGAVQYFHQNTLPEDIRSKRFSKQANLCGVAVHPLYGGWFAIRGAIILPYYKAELLNSLQKPIPLNLIEDVETIAALLEEFGYNWKKNIWRDIYVGCGKKYSQNFMEYLDTEPSRRWEMIKSKRFLSP